MPAQKKRFPLIRQKIAGVPVSELAREFGTPTYVYDAAVIEQRIRDLAPFDTIRYAQKANSNLAVLDLCRRNGVLVDAVSAGEIHRALRAGYTTQGTPPPIVYTADIFDAEALDLVVKHRIPVNCGSPDMITQYGERVSSGEITLRINPGFGHGHSQKTNTGGEQSKHGIWHEDLGACLELARKVGLRVTGIHTHIGSGADMEHLALVSQAVLSFARQAGPDVHTLSAGGGLPIQYREEDPPINIEAYYQIWDRERRTLADEFGHPVHLEIEPGRFLAAECGYLVCEIRAVKKMGKNLFYVVDAGFNNLARPILYGAYHPMSIAHRDGAGSDRPLQDVIVGGPLCESGDIFTQNEGGFVRAQQLPEAAVGDHLVIECAGAYGFVMGSNYNSKTMAAEVLIAEGVAHQVRARQSVEDLFRGESIPPTS